jgi:hypothetical protein
MKNNYLRQTLDLEIFLEGNEIEELEHSPITGELTESGEPLGKKLVIRHYDFPLAGDGIEVEYIKSRPGGWETTTAIEVSLNKNAYLHLKKFNKVGSRHGLGAWIQIYGPGESRF